MDNYKIEKTITKHIIPFQYRESYRELVNKLSSKAEFKKVEEIFDGSVKIHKYIKENFSGDKSVCKHFKLLENTLVDCFVDASKRRSRFLKIKGNSIDGVKEEFKFNISGIDIIVFDSKVGFLVISYEINEKTLENYVKANYFLQSIKTKNIQNIEYLRKVGKDKYESQIISITKVMDAILKHIDIISFMEKGFHNALGKEDLYYPIETLTYSLVLLDNDKLDQNWVRKQSNLLSKGYKSTYKVSNKDVNIGLIEGFDNLVWNVSREGVSNISQLVDDDVTNVFLRNSYVADSPGNIANVYFYIYLLLLNQRYSLIAIAEKINHHLKNIDIDMDYETIREKLCEIRISISKLTLTGIYYDISSNSQYTRYYQKLQESLGIHELLKELDIEISGLDTITQILNQKDEEVRKLDQEDRKKRTQKLTKIISFVAALAWSWDISEIVKQILDDFSIDYSEISVTLVVLIVLILGSFIIAAAINRINAKSES